jgi:hypothetical protein
MKADRSGNATPQNIASNARVVHHLNERSGGSLMNIVEDRPKGQAEGIEIALNIQRASMRPEGRNNDSEGPRAYRTMYSP